MARPGPAKERVQWALALILGAVPFGCLGGQTGQPMSEDGGWECAAPTVDVPVDRPLRGVVPLDAAQALAGSYLQPLAWFDALGNPLPAMADEQITLTFTYDSGLAHYDPCASGGPSIEMLLDVVTSESGIVASGTTTVSFYPPSPGPQPFGPSGQFGSFTLPGAPGSLTGQLSQSQSPSGVSVSGTLFLSEPGVPLRYGRFPPPTTP